MTRAPGLDLDGYLKTNWVGNPTETTVGGRPALAIGVAADEASGLVWSPEDGVVVEINIDSSMAGELRPVVDGVRLGLPGLRALCTGRVAAARRSVHRTA